MRRGAYSRRGAYFKFRVQERRLIEGGAYLREGAYSIKYGIYFWCKYRDFDTRGRREKQRHLFAHTSQDGVS